MAVGCQAINPNGGPRCDVYGAKSAPKVYLRIGSFLVGVRLCAEHQKEAGLQNDQEGSS